MIIADENIPKQIIEALLQAEIKTFSIFLESRGSTDLEIINMAQITSDIILTEDKDFGDLVFAYNQDRFSVILLRYYYTEKSKSTLLRKEY